MTKKDFILLASVLTELSAIKDKRGYILHSDAVTYFADALRSTNPRFDYFRFVEACGATIKN